MPCLVSAPMNLRLAQVVFRLQSGVLPRSGGRSSSLSELNLHHPVVSEQIYYRFFMVPAMIKPGSVCTKSAVSPSRWITRWRFTGAFGIPLMMVLNVKSPEQSGFTRTGRYDEVVKLCAAFQQAVADVVTDRLRAGLRQGDALLLGTDLVKDPAVLLAAYDDAAGVTAAFNKNVLAVLNAELGADFDLEGFDHVAVFNRERSRIEMYLRSSRPQRVAIPGAELSVEFGRGEMLQTEISTKFNRESIERRLRQSGLAIAGWYTDVEKQFALCLSLAGDAIV